MIRRHAVDEILFRDILAIKLTPFGNQTTEKIVGLTAGTGLGAWGLSSALSKGKEGEPAAMSGVIGGIGGAVGGGITGFVLVPAIGKLVRTKKIKVSHNDESYFLLKTKLQPYCLKSR